jgi:hypothetical protein
LKCYNHPDREATGQCENNEHKVFLCAECCAQRIDGFCRKCADAKRYADALKRRSTARIDLAIFALGAVMGAAVGASGITTELIFQVASTGFLGAPLMALSDFMKLNVIFALVISAYIFAALFFGTKFLFVKVWRFVGWGGLIILGFGCFLMTVIYLPIILTVLSIIGAFISPFMLYGARKTLKEPAPVAPTYNYSQPTNPTPSTQPNCPHCNTPTPPNASFCPNCGKPPHQTQEQSNATMKNWVSGST